MSCALEFHCNVNITAHDFCFVLLNYGLAVFCSTAVVYFIPRPRVRPNFATINKCKTKSELLYLTAETRVGRSQNHITVTLMWFNEAQEHLFMFALMEEECILSSERSVLNLRA